MAHVEYLLLLLLGWCSLLWVDHRYGCGVLRHWRRFGVVLAVCLTLFLGWDSLGVHRGYWRSEPGRVLDVWVLPGVPVEEVVLLSLIVYASIVLWRLLCALPRRRHDGTAGTTRTREAGRR
jgi:lycopene cyclase domain-containing protein